MKFINPAIFGRIDPSCWRDVPSFYTASIWPEDLPSSPADYGSNSFHGRTHPDIIKVAIERYTQPGDMVWDCFAGSGTTIDVCKEYGVGCVANDINPTRDDIIKADSRYWHPPYAYFHMVIAHPPYMDVIDFGDGSLSTPNVDTWCEHMADVMENINKVLECYHVLVAIVGIVWRDNQLICLDYEFMHMLHWYWPDKYRLLGRVIRPFGETKGGATSGKRNENLWRYRRLKYSIFELGQDVCLFMQKVR